MVPTIKKLIFASLLLSIALIAAVSAYAAPLYFPHIATSNPWQTEIAIINTSAQTVTGTLRGLSNGGQLIETKAVTLSARGRRQIIVANEFTNHTEIGYIIFDSDSDTVQGYTKFYIEGTYRAAIPAVKEVNTSDIYISHIASTDQWWTGISLVNTTSSTKNLTITFNNGWSIPYTLNANEHKAFTIENLLDNQPQPDIQSAVITNASGIIGLELFGGTGSNNQLDGILLTGNTASTVYYPHVASDNVWWTGIVAYNPSDSTGTITITPYSAAGTPLTPSTRSIAGKEKYIGLVSGLGLPAETAWFKIDSTSPLTGFELFATFDGKQLAAYAGSGAKTGVFAKIEKNGWTGIAFVNMEASAASVTLTACNDNGTAVATRVLTVGGYAKVVNMAEMIFLQDISGANYIAYSSDRNVVGFQLNGSSDGMMLDGLPGLAGAPDTTVLTVFSISGTVSGDVASGVTVTLTGTGAGSMTTTTDGGGNYSFMGLGNGNYTVTPSLVGYTFSPASSAANVSGANIVGTNFVAQEDINYLFKTVCTTFNAGNQAQGLALVARVIGTSGLIDPDATVWVIGPGNTRYDLHYEQTLQAYNSINVPLSISTGQYTFYALSGGREFTEIRTLDALQYLPDLSTSTFQSPQPGEAWTFSWNPVSGASGYYVEILNDYTDEVVYSNVTDIFNPWPAATSIYVPAGIFQEGTPYHLVLLAANNSNLTQATALSYLERNFTPGLPYNIKIRFFTNNMGSDGRGVCLQVLIWDVFDEPIYNATMTVLYPQGQIFPLSLNPNGWYEPEWRNSPNPDDPKSYGTYTIYVSYAGETRSFQKVLQNVWLPSLQNAQVSPWPLVRGQAINVSFSPVPGALSYSVNIKEKLSQWNVYDASSTIPAFTIGSNIWDSLKSGTEYVLHPNASNGDGDDFTATVLQNFNFTAP